MATYNLNAQITSFAKQRQAQYRATGVAFRISHFSVGNQGHDPNDPVSPRTDPPDEFPDDLTLIPAKSVTVDQSSGNVEFLGQLVDDEAVGVLTSFYLWASVTYDPSVESELQAAGFTSDSGVIAAIPVSVTQEGIGTIVHNPGSSPFLFVSPAQIVASPLYSGFTAADEGRIFVFSSAANQVNQGVFPITSAVSADTAEFTNDLAVFEANIAWQLAESLSLAPLTAQSPVVETADLPTVNNTPGDKRLVLLTGIEYWWNGLTWRKLTDRFLYAVARQGLTVRSAGTTDDISFTLID